MVNTVWFRKLPEKDGEMGELACDMNQKSHAGFSGTRKKQMSHQLINIYVACKILYFHYAQCYQGHCCTDMPSFGQYASEKIQTIWRFS